jgi:hypothetical protein
MEIFQDFGGQLKHIESTKPYGSAETLVEFNYALSKHISKKIQKIIPNLFIIEEDDECKLKLEHKDAKNITCDEPFDVTKGEIYEMIKIAVALEDANLFFRDTALDFYFSRNDGLIVSQASIPDEELYLEVKYFETGYDLELKDLEYDRSFDLYNLFNYYRRIIKAKDCEINHNLYRLVHVVAAMYGASKYSCNFNKHYNHTKDYQEIFMSAAFDILEVLKFNYPDLLDPLKLRLIDHIKTYGYHYQQGKGSLAGTFRIYPGGIFDNNTINSYADSVLNV